MTDVYTIDNGIDADLKRVVTWQYDHATKLVQLVLGTGDANPGLLKKFYDAAVGSFWDGIAAMLNIANIPSGGTVSAFGLAVWGKFVGVPRPVLTYQAQGEQAAGQHPMSSELYRRLLVGRFRLANENASYSSYLRFCAFVFGNNVKVVDGQDMGMSFTWVGSASPTTNEEKEQKAAVEDIPDVVFAYPAGVKSSTQSTGPVLGTVCQPVYATSVYGTRCSVSISNTTNAAITLASGSKFTATVEGTSRTYVLDGGYTGTNAYVIGAGKSKTFGFNLNGVIAFVARGTAVTVKTSGGTTISGLTSKVLCSSDYDTNPRTEASGDTQTVSTSVIVRIYGTAGTVIPSGSKFTSGTDVFSTTQAYTIPTGNEGYVDAMFVCSGEKYIKAMTVSSITNAGGASISGVTSVKNRYRSMTDFKIATIGNGSFAWNRFIDR